MIWPRLKWNSWLKPGLLPARRSPLRHFRSKPRRGQPTKKEKTQIRLREYLRSGGHCELRYEGCSGAVLPLEGSVFQRWHLVHLRSKRRFGWASDNLCGGCFHCHIEVRHQKGA